MSINTRHALHPLALAVTLALAACGGNQDTPQTSAPGPQTKADTGLPATTLDTADTPEAARTSASGRATKAWPPPTPRPSRKTGNRCEATC